MKLPIVKILISVTILLAMCGIAPAAIVTQSITYQGVLTDSSGNPHTGTYSMTFKLYDAASGGTALASNTQSVTCTNGLFTTQLPFSSTLYDGRPLWLGVKVGSDPEMTPRQEIRPVPYAESLRPGAVITGDATTNPSLKVINTGNNVAALIAGTTGTNSPALFANAVSSPAVYALSPNDIGVYASGKTGAYFTTNQGGAANADRPAVNVTTAYDFNPGMEITTRGIYSNGISILNTGYQSDAVYISSEGIQGAGVNVHMREAESVGIHSVTYRDDSTGVFGMSEGADCTGVEAYSTGSRSEAIYGYATGTDGMGVYGESKYSSGVSGKGLEGGAFTTRQAGTAVNTYPGVNVSTAFAFNPGIRVRTIGSDSQGVVVQTEGTNSRGVSAYSAQNYGIYGEGVASAGVRGQSSTAAGVYGRSANEYGVYAVTDRPDNKYGVYTPDRMSALAYDANAGDVAEFMPVTMDLVPGTVVIIGDDGKLRISGTAYDTKVAGIVSTEPGVLLGTNEDGNPGEAPIAVAGRVPCRVDASNGPIHPGDLLTTSDNPGYAMKATNPKIGTVLGKALGTLKVGTGTIEVLVTLQ